MRARFGGRRSVVAVAASAVAASALVAAGGAATGALVALHPLPTVAGLTPAALIQADVPVDSTDTVPEQAAEEAPGDDVWLADGKGVAMSSVDRSIGATAVWVMKDSAGQPVTGRGVGVALVDSGVAPVPGLIGAGTVVNGPDLSFESQAANLRHVDTFGHGTHLAGIIAGRDGTTGGFTGVAPGAHLVNLKVATADGAADVTQVIAAIDWAVQHRDDPELNIRVLNLSFGTDSVQDSQLDPLSHAVESAWRHGIVVVVAVGNDGPERTTLAMPAVNPYVIAVSAADGAGTDRRDDDTVADFSTLGNAQRHADLTAPGRSIVSLRNPGSYVDVHYPSGLLPGDATQRYFRGSGTSQAAAVVSGAAALLLQQRPNLTPDQVKRLLTGNADAMPAADPTAAGAGQLNVARAARAVAPEAAQDHPASTGLGTLEASRGSAHVADPDTGADLVGEQDIFGQPWVAARWAAAAGAGAAWDGGSWNGVEWTGTGWDGGDSGWAARTWSARTWSARTWSGVEWSARTWSDAEWTAAGWSARTWSARTWSARTWSAGTWSASGWTTQLWTAGGWPVASSAGPRAG